MVSVSTVGYYLVHPSELRAIIQWYVVFLLVVDACCLLVLVVGFCCGACALTILFFFKNCRKTWHDAVHTRDESKETATEKRCFEFLRKTSRSFSAVIMELHPELLLPVCVFYLVLRGLDTVEDDTSIPIKVQEPLLRGFKDKLEIDGWTFDGNRPEEKDRDLLLEFDNVIAEFKNIKPAYQAIIKDIADRMGNGMADYCVKADMGDDKVDTIADYDLYCYYVAGLVGEGLTRLFVEAGFARPQLLERPELFKSMGLFLQKTNIIRDVREDQDDNRRFWPKGIWSKHVSRWEDLFNPEYTDEALNCNSEMIHNALEHADDCVFYLAGLTEQSVFNFCAIPQTMAIATLEACFRNPVMFQRNVKITKGEACRLMSQSTQNVRLVCDLFRQYSRLIHKKNNAKDPSFLFISVACGKVSCPFPSSLYVPLPSLIWLCIQSTNILLRLKNSSNRSSLRRSSRTRNAESST